MQDAEMSAMISYIEDGDLWRWRLPDAKAFYAGLRAQRLEYDANQNPGIFDELLELTCKMLIDQVHSQSLVSQLKSCQQHSHCLTAWEWTG